MKRLSIHFHANCGSGVPIVALGVIAVAAGVYHGSSLGAALGILLLAAPAAVHWALRRSVAGIRLTRAAPDCAFEGDTVEVKITLHNTSRLPLFLPEVSEVFTPEIHTQKDVLFPYRVFPGEKVTESYTGDCILPRGVHTLGPLAVSVSDPLGWFQARRVFSDPRPFKIYPRFAPFGAREKLGGSHSLLLDERTRFGLGDSNEFFSVREYRAGDPLRRIHWGLTAHRGFPVIREHARNVSKDLTIVLDLYRSSYLGTGRGSSLEQAVKITASLAAHALRRRHRVQVLARGATSVWVPPRAAASHLRAVLDALVEVKPDGETPLDLLLELEARRIRPGSTAVIMVSPYLRPSREFAALGRKLVQRGVRVLLVVFDDSSFKSIYETAPAEPSLDVFLREARGAGMECITVACGGNLRATFAREEAGRA
ncbi:MAG TPA: DUF58 domain-containing protein [Planctomycetota bacterium]|nr:DUF58 domain-containing protein [Planctomycetota bacterium]